MEADYDDILILTIFVLLLAFIKFNFFLRIFSNFRFLVNLLKGVFLDLRYFLAFFSFVIMEFGLLFYIILDGKQSSSIGFF